MSYTPNVSLARRIWTRTGAYTHLLLLDLLVELLLERAELSRAGFLSLDGVCFNYLTISLTQRRSARCEPTSCTSALNVVFAPLRKVPAFEI